MNSAEVDAVWRSVDAPAGSLALGGKPAPGLPPDRGILLAVDSQGLRHLLLPSDQGAEPPSRPNTKGLDVTLDELQAGEHPARVYLDVACRDTAATGMFTVVATEILTELAAGAENSQQVLARVLARWRWFWETPVGGLSDTEAVGLFGELWFLEFWLGPIDRSLLSTWTGPAKDRHDFKSVGASVEVKATRARSDGAATHRITTLDQLEDPEQGQLHLFSLRISPDPVATHSLNASIARIRASFGGDPDLSREFDQRLAAVGYNPADRERYDETFRVVAEELYRVDGAFPRLTRDSFSGGLPSGVDEIAYSLDLAACASWRIATAPGDVSRALRETMLNPA